MVFSFWYETTQHISLPLEQLMETAKVHYPLFHPDELTWMLRHVEPLVVPTSQVTWWDRRVPMHFVPRLESQQPIEVRRARNRIHARASRERQRDRIEMLEKELSEKNARIHILQAENAKLLAEKKKACDL